ncbi:MAG: thioredoxin family protein [Roseiarcus sp.]|jgi:predicted dithiol-disulfide oxidoreductase (DUF899 family)
MAKHHDVVLHDAWIDARKKLLVEEKEFTRLRDRLSQRRRDLPWERVQKDYVFDGPDGKRTLAELFDGRSQLIVYHFMLGPDWAEGCKSCSFWADQFDGADVHLANRDVTLLAVSRAPLPKIEAYKKRMGWRFKWVSSFGSDFNFDYGVSPTPEALAAGETVYNFAPIKTSMTELPGISVFARDADGAVFHTYSCYARGLDMLNGAYQYLDLAPKGRDEAGLPYGMSWVRRHDEYGR